MKYIFGKLPSDIFESQGKNTDKEFEIRKSCVDAAAVVVVVLEIFGKRVKKYVSCSHRCH